jgi:hypothetical protein
MQARAYLSASLSIDGIAPYRPRAHEVELAKVYGFTDVDGSRPDAWRYAAGVQDAEKPADATGYR